MIVAHIKPTAARLLANRMTAAASLQKTTGSTNCVAALPSTSTLLSAKLNQHACAYLHSQRMIAASQQRSEDKKSSQPHQQEEASSHSSVDVQHQSGDEGNGGQSSHISRRRGVRGSGRSREDNEDQAAMIVQRDDDPTDLRHLFDDFRENVNRIMMDFDQAMGGGLLASDRGNRRDREHRGGFFSSLFPGLIGSGGDRSDAGRLFGRVRDDTENHTSPMLLGGDPAGTTLSPFSPILDLIPPVQPIPMKLDVEDQKDKYALTAEEPGLRPKDLKVHVDQGVLTIEGHHEEKHKNRDRHYIRVERSLGVVRRSSRLPEDVDASKVTAKYDHGTLKIDLPKKPLNERTISGNVKIEHNEGESDDQQHQQQQQQQKVGSEPKSSQQQANPAEQPGQSSIVNH